MHTYLTHNLSLAMMPALAADDRPVKFSWTFEEIDDRTLFAEITRTAQLCTFANYLHLPALDNILHEKGQDYGVDLPERDGHSRRMHLNEGDTLLVVKYRGRKLLDDDRVLPPGAHLHYYRMTVTEVVRPDAWTQTVTQHAIPDLS